MLCGYFSSLIHTKRGIPFDVGFSSSCCAVPEEKQVNLAFPMLASVFATNQIIYKEATMLCSPGLTISASITQWAVAEVRPEVGIYIQIWVRSNCKLL